MARWFNFNNIALLTVVLLLALFTLWLQGQLRGPAPTVRDTTVPHIPDFTLSNFEAVAMDANGVPRQRMQAPELLHYADDGTALVISPDVTVYNAETPPWRLNAEQGYLSADGNSLRLSGEVFARRKGEGPHQAVAVTTRDVDVDLLTDVAVTEAPVSIVADSGTTDAIGMRARFAENRLLLKQRVRGRYVVAD